MFALHFCCVDCKHFTFSCQLANKIGDTGAKHLANMLKVNTTLTRLVFFSELWFVFICSIVVRFMHDPDILNDCVSCNIDSEIDDDGVRDIAEALKVNSTLVDINLAGGHVFFCVFFHSRLMHS